MSSQSVAKAAGGLVSITKVCINQPSCLPPPYNGTTPETIRLHLD